METKPRKTKAQRMQVYANEIAAQREQELVEFQSTYTTRLLALVGEYITHFPTWIKYADSTSFIFTNNRSYDYDWVTLHVSPTLVIDNFEQIRDNMETVQRWISDKIEADRAANELESKKNAARAKLTKEELKLLGL